MADFVTRTAHQGIDTVAANWKPIALTVAGLYAAKTAFGFISASRKQSAIKKRMAQSPKDLPVIIAFPIADGDIGLSMPCVKAITCLRLMKQPHKIVFTMDPSDSPTERLPCMELNGECVPESDYIIETIIAKFGISDKSVLVPLSAQEEHEGFLFSRLIDYSTRLASVRHAIVNNTSTMVNMFHKKFGIPRIFAWLFVTQDYRPGSIAMLNAHGQGDLPEPKFYEEFLKDVKAIEGQLIKVNGPDVTAHKGGIASAKGFSRYDAPVFAMLNFLVVVGPECSKCEATALIASSPAIKSFMRRVEAAADYASLRQVSGLQKLPEYVYQP